MTGVVKKGYLAALWAENIYFGSAEPQIRNAAPTMALASNSF
jgi:hypothetical protein